MATKTITGCVDAEGKIKFGAVCDEDGYFPDGCIVPSGGNAGKVKIEISRCLKAIYPLTTAANITVIEYDISGILELDTNYVVSLDVKQLCWEGVWQVGCSGRHQIRIHLTAEDGWLSGDVGCLDEGVYGCMVFDTPGYHEATVHSDDLFIPEAGILSIEFRPSKGSDCGSPPAGWVCKEFAVIDYVSLKEVGSEEELLSNGDFSSGMTGWEWGDANQCAGSGVSSAACDGSFYGCVDPINGIFEVELPDITCW